MARLYAEAREGKLDAQTATRLASIVVLAARLIGDAELKAPIARLEAERPVVVRALGSQCSAETPSAGVFRTGGQGLSTPYAPRRRPGGHPGPSAAVKR